MEPVGLPTLSQAAPETPVVPAGKDRSSQVRISQSRLLYRSEQRTASVTGIAGIVG